MQTSVQGIVRDLAAIKDNSPKSGEVKWTNAKSFGGRVHRAYIDYLFTLIDSNLAHFHIRFSPMGEYDHDLSGPRKRIDTVSKSYYQLLLHRPIAFYGDTCSVHVHPDDGDCTSELEAQIPAFNYDERTLFNRSGAIQEIQPRSSAREPMLQLLDVTLGALAAYRNGRHEKQGISTVKADLMEYAFQKTKLRNIRWNCPPKRVEFNCWNVKPKFKRGRQR